jgi:hypothetical protein
MPPPGFKPAIATRERPQTHALDGAATGIGEIRHISKQFTVLCAWEEAGWIVRIAGRSGVSRAQCYITNLHQHVPVFLCLTYTLSLAQARLPTAAVKSPNLK